MRIVKEDVLGVRLELETDEEMFSPGHVDRGTKAMLSTLTLSPGMRVMDLGCGCGVVGIYCAKTCGAENVFMADVDAQAVEIALRNAARNGVNGIRAAVSDGFDNVDEAGFDLILSNPPYQSDFSVAKRFIQKGFNRLKLGGRMIMVTKRLDWYRNKLTSIFGGVRVKNIDGYYVFEAEKKNPRYANK